MASKGANHPCAAITPCNCLLTSNVKRKAEGGYKEDIPQCPGGTEGGPMGIVALLWCQIRLHKERV